MIKKTNFWFPIPTVELFTPEGKSLGQFDDLQMLDARVQIAEQGLEGYYIKYIDMEDKEAIINIDKYGKIDKWDDYLFEQGTKLDLTIKLRTLQVTKDPEEIKKYS